MAVYVDPLIEWGKRPGWPYNEACHLMADTDEELHAFAGYLGLKRSWAQSMDHPRQYHHHYDLTKNKRAQAVRLGATEVSIYEMAEIGVGIDPPTEECDGSATCAATEHIHGCYRSRGPATEEE